jgi:signal transduction histidine kinase
VGGIDAGIGLGTGLRSLATLTRPARHPRDVHTAMDVSSTAGAQNGTVHRDLRTRLRRAWRAGQHSLWPDVALAAVLSLAAVWLTLHRGDESGGGDISLLPLPEPSEGPLPAPLPAPPSGVARDVVLNLLITVPLIGRRRWPLACLTVQFVGLLAFEHGVNAATLAALLIGAYSLAVYGRSALLSMSALLVAAGVTTALRTNTWPPLPERAGAFAILLPIGLFGVAIRAARGRARASEQRAEALEREQQAATRLAVAQEQARIARELHDVVSHHVSVMTIQAGAAGKVLDADPEQARSALSAIEAGGRETMAELRHLLGVLTPGPTDDLLHPQPGLDQLDALIEGVRQAGQPVSARRTPVALPRGVDLTAYRVVQEALTNALRHAPGAPTDIVITTEASTAPASAALTADGRTDLVIEVTNDAPPPGTPPGAADGSGTGLLGLAERLRLYGGTLETGRRAGGGFRVRARLPLDATARPEAPLEPA